MSITDHEFDRGWPKEWSHCSTTWKLVQQADKLQSQLSFETRLGIQDVERLL